MVKDILHLRGVALSCSKAHCICCLVRDLHTWAAGYLEGGWTPSDLAKTRLGSTRLDRVFSFDVPGVKSPSKLVHSHDFIYAESCSVTNVIESIYSAKKPLTTGQSTWQGLFIFVLPFTYCFFIKLSWECSFSWQWFIVMSSIHFCLPKPKLFFSVSELFAPVELVYLLRFCLKSLSCLVKLWHQLPEKAWISLFISMIILVAMLWLRRPIPRFRGCWFKYNPVCSCETRVAQKRSGKSVQKAALPCNYGSCWLWCLLLAEPYMLRIGFDMNGCYIKELLWPQF